MRTMRVVCTGGRNYLDGAKIFATLNLLEPTEIYVGDCPTGADALVREWAEDKQGTDFSIFHADWKTHGKAAGPIRNRIMLDDAGSDALVIAFPGERGTRDCMMQALENGMIVLEVKP